MGHNNFYTNDDVRLAFTAGCTHQSNATHGRTKLSELGAWSEFIESRTPVNASLTELKDTINQLESKLRIWKNAALEAQKDLLSTERGYMAVQQAIETTK